MGGALSLHLLSLANHPHLSPEVPDVPRHADVVVYEEQLKVVEHLQHIAELAEVDREF